MLTVPRWIILSVFAVLLCLTSICTAQDVPREGARRKSPRVIIVMDVSGSMLNSDKLPAAVEWALRNIINVPTDGIEIGLITFAGSSHRHTYVNDDGEVSEWFQLPSKHGLEQLTGSITTVAAHGNTEPAHAMVQGLKSGAQSLVLISDGEFFSLPMMHLMSEITRIKRWAQENNVILPVVTVMGIHPSDSDRRNLVRVAEATDNSLWIKEKPQPAPEDEDSSSRGPPPKIGPHKKTALPIPHGGVDLDFLEWRDP